MKKLTSALTALSLSIAFLSFNAYADFHNDVDQNGKVETDDALAVLKTVVGLDNTYKNNSDTDGDGKITTNDALVILEDVVFPTESEYKNGVHYFEGIPIINKTYAASKDYAPKESPEARKAFNQMQANAKKSGIYLSTVSGYRTYSYQKKLYDNYVKRDGKELADTYSARPGHSEHQTGLVFDVNNASDSFAGTPAAKWLAEHCHEYGFIIRYPKDKVNITGYQYEPWHIRYVGKELAEYLYTHNLCLEEYFGIDSIYS